MALGSQITVSPSGKTSVGNPARHAGSVALVIPMARPLAVGPCGCIRPALHFDMSSSPARPFIADGASNVSQNAASGKPQPGLAMGPTGAEPSTPGDAPPAPARAVPPTPGEASPGAEDPSEPMTALPPPPDSPPPVSPS